MKKPKENIYYDWHDVKNWLKTEKQKYKLLDKIIDRLNCPDNGTLIIINKDDYIDSEEDYDEDLYNLVKFICDNLTENTYGNIHLHYWW